MNKSYFIKLLRKYLKGRASEEECNYLFAYYNLFEKEPDVIKLLNDEQKEEIKNQLRKDIWADINRLESSKNFKSSGEELFKSEAFYGKKRKGRWLGKLQYIAATVLLFMAIGFLFLKDGFLTNRNPEITSELTFKNDIAPGTDKATLTLSDGTVINLSDSVQREIALLAGSAILKSENGQLIYNLENVSSVKGGEIKYNTLSTPRGGQYQIILPDGSRVWLNSASSLRFPEQFDGSRREVELNGEAYFEIASMDLSSEFINKKDQLISKDKKVPFIVKTANQEVEVLGTKFNINAYEEESTTNTTLVEGSVRVTSSSINTSMLLVPNQQSVLWTKNNEIKVRNVDVNSVIGWKNGMFSFKAADLSTVMMQLSRWYDVEVVYEGTMSRRQFSGEISRNINISGILEFLSFLDVKFRIEDTGSFKRIVVLNQN